MTSSAMRWASSGEAMSAAMVKTSPPTSRAASPDVCSDSWRSRDERDAGTGGGEPAPQDGAEPGARADDHRDLSVEPEVVARAAHGNEL